MTAELETADLAPAPLDAQPDPRSVIARMIERTSRLWTMRYESECDPIEEPKGEQNAS